MKKKLLPFILLALGFVTAEAQSWKLVINKTDGQTVELATSDIQDIQFVSEEETPPTLPDQNVDQLVIKEIYVGGCPKDDGSGFFAYDKYIVLYNNCPQRVVANNLCFGMGTPYNSNADNQNYDDNGALVYEADGFTPAQNGIWYYPYSLVVEPYGSVVINIQGAIDNTQTYSQSVNFANKDYYCMYDPESGYNLPSYYPTPADVIPTTHYWKAAKFGKSTAWPISMNSPALFLYQTHDVDPFTHAMDADNMWYSVGKPQNDVWACTKVPNEWIIDAVEVFNATAKPSNKKRLVADLDGGYVYHTDKLGHSVYRNVDKESTEALSENNGLLVYGYAQGVDDSTDPSGIDAEASIRKGAHIIYLDTDNSTQDFHERAKCSLRD